jgi:hypothetical protein
MRSLLLGVCHFKSSLAIHSCSAFPTFPFYNYWSGSMKRGKYLVPLTNSVSLTILEQPLVVRNAVIAVDEAGAEVLLAIVFWLRNDTIPGISQGLQPHFHQVQKRPERLGRVARRGIDTYPAIMTGLQKIDVTERRFGVGVKMVRCWSFTSEKLRLA